MKILYAFRIEEDLLERLKDKAKVIGIGVPAIIRRLIIKYLANEVGLD